MGCGETARSCQPRVTALMHTVSECKNELADSSPLGGGVGHVKSSNGNGQTIS
jgi:hypothetical protein